MVIIDAFRLAGEALTESPVSIQLNAQAMTLVAEGVDPVAILVPRLAGEVLLKVPPRVQLAQQSLTLVAESDDTVAILVPRLAGEVLLRGTPIVQMNQQSLTLVAESAETAAVRVPRLVGEVLMRAPAAAPTPITLPDDLTWWLHNWVQVPTLTTEFVTTIETAPETGTEGRRAGRQKPRRFGSVLIGPVEGRAEVQELIRYAKRFNRERMVMPIFDDVTVVTANAEDSDNFVMMDTTEGRFFNGARVVILQLGPLQTITNALVRRILTTYPDKLTFTTLLGVDLSAPGTVVMPLLDVEQVGSTKFTFVQRGDAGQAEIEFAEISGDSTLPALGIGGGVSAHSDGRYIWPFDHNWAENLETELVTPGEVTDSGNASFFQPDGPAPFLIHRYQTAGARATQFAANRFFEAHLGRLLAFWHIDQKCLWEAAAYRSTGNPTFLDISPLGDFEAFVADIEETDYIGLVLSNGRRLVREVVTITDGVTWRLTVSEALPAGYTVEDVVHVAVARDSRFDHDALTENYEAPIAGRMSFDIRELLGEEDTSL